MACALLREEYDHLRGYAMEAELSGSTKRRPHVRKLANGAIGFVRIVIPLDGTPAAEEILGDLAHVARPTAQVILVRAVPSASQLVAHAADASTAGLVDLVRVSERGRREAHSYLESVASDLVRRGFDARTTVAYEPAADAILRAAEHVDAELIAMTTHARGGVERVLFGSVADAVLRGSSRPVFLKRLSDGGESSNGAAGSAA